MQPTLTAGGGGRSLAPLAQQPAVKAVHVYRNGDPYYRGRRMLIHEKRVGTFEVFLKDVTGGVQAPFGAVRNLYTPRYGHRVTSLEDLQPGECYVAGGRESFKKLDYAHIGENKRKTVDPMSQTPSEEDLSAEVKPVSHSRINVSARFRKNVQEPCTVFLIANGDVMNPVIRLLIPRKVLDQWELVLAMVTDRVKLRNGAVHKLYTLDGIPIQDGSELENGQFYVAVGRDKFKKLPYNDLIFSKASVRRSYGSKASSLPPINGYRKSKENRHERQTKSTGGSTDAVDTIISPQPPKPKPKKNPEAQILNKPVKVKQKKEINNNYIIYTRNDDGIFKAGEDRSEMWGASEVQEDENTKVEVPVDQRVAETVEEEVQDPEDADGGEAVDEEEEEEEADDVGHDNIPPDENQENSIINHEVEASHEKLNNFIEDDVEASHEKLNNFIEDDVNNEAELQEEDQHFNSADMNGENSEQINGDMYEKEEGEDEIPDGNTDEKSQAEYSLPRPTSSRLLEKASTPTDTEKDLEPEA
ncbi:doublecortin domain-containing protein 2 isoform X2 [Rana temporaria]|uniref:doublecortin domain-containing protein 2 isoform X2 n=1 Tax=Rana temporaria TaxID=8407 RepID=UPI001AADBE23|nr:doublecortin domain-containing protein 2 isoform X2 [Rana temporaria]